MQKEVYMQHTVSTLLQKTLLKSYDLTIYQHDTGIFETKASFSKQVVFFSDVE